MQTKPKAPDLIYVGMSKAGSTYIYQILREHPGVFVPVIKDLYFFDREYERGLSWYSRFFENAASGQVRAELSHDYIFSPDAARRIAEDLPGVKLIICLREPVDWICSRLSFEEGRRRIGRLDLRDLPENRWIRDESNIDGNVGLYLRTFPRENILILFYEDLKRDPEAFCRRIYAFAGVAEDFQPPSLGKVVLPAHEPRLKALSHLAQAMADLLRRLGLQRVVGFLKNLPLVEKLLFRRKTKSYALTAEEEAAVMAYFRPKVKRLEELLGNPLPEEWRRRFGP